MAKIQVQHPTHEKIVEFETKDILTAATSKGATVIIEHEHTVIRLGLNWSELAGILCKALNKAQECSGLKPFDI